MFPILPLLLFPPVSTKCYNTKCSGAGAYASIYIDCNNEYNQCSIGASGAPYCINYGSSGDGVYCSEDGHMCTFDETTGEASCIAKLWNCYDKNCLGKGDYYHYTSPCNTDVDSYCTHYASGLPRCVWTGSPAWNATGVNCEKGPADCGSAFYTGAAFCRTDWDCYDRKCRGEYDREDYYIECDNQYSQCSLEQGRVVCNYVGATGAGDGVNCTGLVCSWNGTTGAAFCGAEKEGLSQQDPIVGMIIVGSVIAVYIVLQLLYCNCKRRCARERAAVEENRMRNHNIYISQDQPSAVEEHPAPVVFENLTAEPEHPELTTSPPPDYEEVDAYNEGRSQNYRAHAPPSYDECLVNADKF